MSDEDDRAEATLNESMRRYSGSVFVANIEQARANLRIARALESIAASLEKIANPPVLIQGQGESLTTYLAWYSEPPTRTTALRTELGERYDSHCLHCGVEIINASRAELDEFRAYHDKEHPSVRNG
jgi:hypothetical protein